MYRTRRRSRFIRRTGRGYRRKMTFRRRTVRSIVRRQLWRNAETKIFNETQPPISLISSESTEISFFAEIQQGTQNNQRIGNQIHAKRYGVNFVFSWAINGSPAQYQVNLRFILLYPRKGVDSGTLNAYLTNNTPGLYDRPDPTIFFTLMDKFITLQASNPGYSAGGVPSIYRLRFSRRAKYILNYNSDGEVDRYPILYIVNNKNSVDANTVLTLQGYKYVSFKDF